MKPGEPFFRLLTIASGIGFSLLSLFGMFLPTTYLNTLLTFSQTSPSVNSHFRYLNALFLSYAVMLFMLFVGGAKYRQFLLILAVGMIAGAAVRALGILIDGLPNVFMVLAMIGEFVLGILYLVSYRLSAPATP